MRAPAPLGRAAQAGAVSVAVPQRLASVPIAGLVPIGMDEANALIVWELIRDDAGSSGGGTWTRQRNATDATQGRKRLWLWRYA
jgi:hypothetical protein